MIKQPATKYSGCFCAFIISFTEMDRFTDLTPEVTQKQGWDNSTLLRCGVESQGGFTW